MNFQTMSKQRKFVLIAAAVGLISMFLPWASVFGYSISGMHGDGIIVFICFIVAGLLAFMGDQTKNLDKSFWMGVLIAGGLGAIIMIIELLRGISNIGFFGFGFWIGFLASLGVVGAAWMYRSPTDSFKDGFDSFKKDIGDKMGGSGTGTTGTGGSNPPA